MNYKYMWAGRIPFDVIPKWRLCAEEKKYSISDFKKYLEDLVEVFKNQDISRFKPLETELQKAKESGDKVRIHQIENSLIMENLRFRREQPDMIEIQSEMRRQLELHGMMDLYLDFIKIFDGVETKTKEEHENKVDVREYEKNKSIENNDENKNQEIKKPIQTMTTINPFSSQFLSTSPPIMATAKGTGHKKDTPQTSPQLSTLEILIQNFSGKASPQDICSVTEYSSADEATHLLTLWREGKVLFDKPDYYTFERGIMDLFESNKTLSIQEIHSALAPHTLSKKFDMDILVEILTSLENNRTIKIQDDIVSLC